MMITTITVTTNVTATATVIAATVFLKLITTN